MLKKTKPLLHRQDETKEVFKIPQMPDDSVGLRVDKPKFEKTEALSPMAGYYVKEVDTIPEAHEDSHEDIDIAYDAFRVKPKLTEEDEIKRYGQNYHEFRSIDSHIDAKDFDYNKEVVKEEKKESFGINLGTIVSDDEFLNPVKKVPTKDFSVPEVKVSPEVEEPTYNQSDIDDFNRSLKELRFSNEEVAPEIEQEEEPVKESEPVYKPAPIVETKVEEENALPKTIIFKNPTPKVMEEAKPLEASFTFGSGALNSEEEKRRVPDFITTPKEVVKEPRTFEAPEFSAPEAPSQFEELQKTQPLEEAKRVYVDKYQDYEFPPYSLFNPVREESKEIPEWVTDKIEIINNTLTDFGVDGEVVTYTYGPAVTRYEVKLSSGVNVRKIVSIEDNLKMNLSARSIRIEAPIPGKSNVGIEVPNNKIRSVNFLEVAKAPEFRESTKPLNVVLGLNIDGKPVCIDIAKMPHGLVGGSTGSGKSVCINTLLVSLLMRNTPDQVKLILVDPKQVELVNYEDLPHLATPVISDVHMASEALKWATIEMDRRYKAFSSVRAKDLESFNLRIKNDPSIKKLAYIVIIIDELADLMITCGNEVEDSIQRITQMGRAAGIHIIVATQRPTTDVVKGTIKNNIPTRIAFRVSSYVDSATILDQAGAENLLGRGDMLLKELDAPVRVQGAFISDEEIMNVCDYIRDRYKPDYLFTHDELQESTKQNYFGASNNEDPELIYNIATNVIERGMCSVNNIQSTFCIGFNRASRIVDIMEEMGIVSGKKGTTGRDILMTQADVDELFSKGN